MKILKIILFIIIFATVGVILKSPVYAGELGNQFTVSLWVNPQSSAASKALVVKNNEIRLVTNASSQPVCQIYSAGAWQTAVTSSTVLSLNTWSYVACSYDKSNLLVFINGVQTGSQALTVAVNDAATNFRTGSDEGATYGDLNGSADDVRVYNYARTSKQIVEDMNAGHPAPGSPVGSAVGYWKFDEGYNTTANNSGSGSNLSGTVTNATWSNNGKFGKALSFDGNGDVVTTTSDASIDTSLAHTYTFWFNATTWQGNKAIVSDWTNNDLGTMIYIQSSSTICAYVNNTEKYCGTVPSAGAWHYGALVYDTSYIYLYIDGKLQGSTAAGTADGGNFQIGEYNSSIGTSFTGLIDEVKIYNYALTSDEIALDYNHGSAMVLGTLSDNSSYEKNAANQEYCVPGDTTACAAPVGEWKMDEKTGGYAYDTSGNGNVGTLTNGPTWTQGKVGAALKFDGSDDYVDVGKSFVNDITIEGWIYPQSLGSRQVISQGIQSSGVRWWIYFSSNKLNWGIYDGAWQTATSDSIIPTNQWIHFVAVGDVGTNDGVQLYINGKKQAITDTASSNTSYGTVYIGTYCSTPTGGTYNFNGLIDQVRIYDYARTPAQVAWDYNRGGPVGWWKMDECQGGTANDSSGNGNNGTITIGATGTNTSVGTCTGSAGEAWKDGAVGKYNSSLEFDGTDDYVSLSNPSSLNNITTKTISFWTYLNAQVGAGGVGSHWLNKGDSSGGWFVSTDPGNSRNIYGQHFGAGTAGRWSFPQFSISQWHHVVVIYDRSSTANNPLIYVDGISQTVTRYSTPTGTAGDDSGNSLLISKSPGYDRFVSGQIDDVKIFNYALTGTQVKSLYNAGAAVQFAPITGTP